MTMYQLLLGAGSGAAVGLTLGLVGGGGSILAVPLMIYVVGVSNSHIAIGTSAIAVAANAGCGLCVHALNGHVRWRCGAIYTLAGIAGAFAGSTVGKHLDSQKLMFFFALIMIAVSVLMLRKPTAAGSGEIECTLDTAPRVLGTGLSTGAISGFFGIGGGLLVVPGLILSTGMPIINAIATSLVAVTAFGLTTAINYATSDMIDWLLAIAFVAGGVAGGVAGTSIAGRLAPRSHQLRFAFATLVFGVGVYMLTRSSFSLN